MGMEWNETMNPDWGIKLKLWVEEGKDEEEEDGDDKKKRGARNGKKGGRKSEPDGEIADEFGNKIVW